MLALPDTAVSSSGCGAPQLPQKFSLGATFAPHALQRVMGKLPGEQKTARSGRAGVSLFLRDAEPQGGLANDDLVAILQWLTVARRQPPSAINKSSVGRSQIFDC